MSCKFCNGHKTIQVHRPENLGVHDVFLHQSNPTEGTAMFFQNAKGMPAYIDIEYCPFCGENLKVKE